MGNISTCQIIWRLIYTDFWNFSFPWCFLTVIIAVYLLYFIYNNSAVSVLCIYWVFLETFNLDFIEVCLSSLIFHLFMKKLNYITDITKNRWHKQNWKQTHLNLSQHFIPLEGSRDRGCVREWFAACRSRAFTVSVKVSSLFKESNVDSQRRSTLTTWLLMAQMDLYL